MIIIRRSAGVGAVLLSVLGLLLCIGVAAGVWVGKRQVNGLNAALFGTADEAFAFMETRLDRVQQALVASRQRVGGVSRLAEQLKTAGGDGRGELQPLVQTLDDAFEKLKAAENGLDSTEAIARGVNRMSDAIATSRAAGSDDESAGVNARRIAEFSASVADALARLQAMRQELIDLRESGQLARDVAAAIITRAAELDERLGSVSARIDRFSAEVAAARDSSVDLGRRIHWWTTFAALMLALVALWFAISQVAMIKHGWRLARHPGANS